MTKTISLILALLWVYGAGGVWAADSLQGTLEHSRTSEVSTWVDPDTGQTTSIVPTRTFQNAVGQHCREFTQTVTIAGEKQQAYGTACRQPDGSWKIVNDQPAASQVQVQPPEVVYLREAPARYGYPYAYWPYYPYPYYDPFSLVLSFGYVFGGGHGGGHYGGHGGHGGGGGHGGEHR